MNKPFRTLQRRIRTCSEPDSTLNWVLLWIWLCSESGSAHQWVLFKLPSPSCTCDCGSDPPDVPLMKKVDWKTNQVIPSNVSLDVDVLSNLASKYQLLTDCSSLNISPVTTESSGGGAVIFQWIPPTPSTEVCALKLSDCVCIVSFCVISSSRDVMLNTFTVF